MSQRITTDNTTYTRSNTNRKVHLCEFSGTHVDDKQNVSRNDLRTIWYIDIRFNLRVKLIHVYTTLKYGLVVCVEYNCSIRVFILIWREKKQEVR